MKAVPAERSNGLTGKWLEQLAAEMRQKVHVDREFHLSLNKFFHSEFKKDAEIMWVS